MSEKFFESWNIRSGLGDVGLVGTGKKFSKPGRKGELR